jgi:hypothetical protein
VSFSDCINTAAQTGRLSQAKADEALQAYAEAMARAGADGLSDAAAEAGASNRAMEEVGQRVAEARYRKIQTIKKEHAIYTLLHESKKPTSQLAGHNVVAPMDTLTAKIEATQGAVLYQLMSNMAAVAEKFSSKFLGLIKPIETMDDMARGVYGEDVSPAAKILAEQYSATQEYERKLLNLEGANIPENPNRRMTQVHDRLAVRSAGRDAWVNDHLKDDVLDWEIMQYDGKEIPADQREGILRRVYDAIVSNGKNKISEAFGGESFMQRLQRERFLYYKSADAWLEMNEKYGKGNAYVQLLRSVENTARGVGILRHLGPVPENGIAFAKRTLDKLIGVQGLDMKVKSWEKLRTSLNRELGSFDQQMDMLMGKVDHGEGDAVVQTVNSARSILGTSMLGGMAVTSLSDPFYAMWFRQVNNLPFVKTIPHYISSLLHLKNFKREALNSGFGLESTVRNMHDTQRFTLNAEGGKLAHLLSELNLRATGMSILDDITHARAGYDIADVLAKHQHTPFDDVPFVEFMRNLGITEKDWSFIKDAPLYEPEYYDGHTFFGKANLLRPVDMWNSAGDDAGREAANKFMMLQEVLARGSRPIGGVRTRALLGGATSARSVAGQVARTSAQFLISPASIMFTHWRVAMGAPRMWGLNGKVARFSTLMLYTTAAGAMIQQIKEVLKNRSLADMTTPEFWIKSMILGGCGAILGDFIYNNVTASGGPFSGSNPTVETAKKLYAAVAEPAKWAMGDDTAHPIASEMEAVWSLLPKPQPARYAMERMMYDPALQYMDPAAYERKKEKELELLDRTGQQELVHYQ